MLDKVLRFGAVLSLAGCADPATHQAALSGDDPDAGATTSAQADPVVPEVMGADMDAALGDDEAAPAAEETIEPANAPQDAGADDDARVADARADDPDAADLQPDDAQVEDPQLDSGAMEASVPEFDAGLDLPAGVHHLGRGYGVGGTLVESPVITMWATRVVNHAARVKVDQLCFYAGTSQGVAAMALFTDEGGAPADRIAATRDYVPAVANASQCMDAVGGAELVAGQAVWIAMQADGQPSFYRFDVPGSTSYSTAETYAYIDAPTPYPLGEGTTAYPDTELSLFIVTHDLPTSD